MITLTGQVQGISSFSTSSSPGLEIEFLLDKTNARSPDVIVKVVAYSKLVPLFKEVKNGTHLEIQAEPRNGSSKDQVFFLLTYLKRPTQ